MRAGALHLFLPSSHSLAIRARSSKVAKYVALRSSKGYAIGAKFREWMDARLADQEEQDNVLLGFSEDMLAICGSRMYVFFLDAGPRGRPERGVNKQSA